jgi:hypothetical protein
MEAVIVYPLLAAALYYLGARAKITKPIWQLWEDTWFSRFLECAACSGFWYGTITSSIGYALGWHLFGAHAWWTIPTTAIASIVTTPLLAAAHERAMHQLSYGESMPTAIVQRDQDEATEEPDNVVKLPSRCPRCGSIDCLCPKAA